MALELSKFAASAWHSVRVFTRAHKIISTIILIALCYGAWHLYSAANAPSTATRYVLTNVATGTVIASLSETGQVDALRQINITPQNGASGQVTAVYVTQGEQVYAGQALAQLDATDAIQALANAKLSLANTQISYKQATATSTLALNLLTAQNGVTNAQTALQKTHDDSYASLTSIYTDFSSTMSGLDSVLHDYSTMQGHTNQENIDAYADAVNQNDASIPSFKNAAETDYTNAVNAYNAALADYQATSRSASNDDLVTLADTTYTAAQSIADAVTSAHDFFNRVNADYTLYNLTAPSSLASLITSVNGYTTTVNGDLSTALSIKSNIVSAEQSLAQAQNTLANTEGGSNTISVQQAELSLRQAQQTVTNDEQTLADYTITAPIAGTIASVGVKQYDQASSGTTIATLVTNTEEVDVSVNEIDAASLKVGQKATVTFDALPNVSIAGTVSQVGIVGTVSQGVVSYTATISLDTNNPDVKPGMSATADIITNSATGLVVPASAITTSGGRSFVLAFQPPIDAATISAAGSSGITSDTAPTRIPVEVGLSDDTNTIITSGLSSGEQIVARTIAGSDTTASAAAQSTSIIGGSRTTGGASRGGGNVLFRAGGG